MKTCTWAGCDRATTRRNGLCALGHKRITRGWIDHDTPPAIDRRRLPRPPGKCSWEGCEEQAYCRGLCRKGYKRMHAQGWVDHDTPAIDRSAGTCTWPGCDEPHEALGLCGKGYSRTHKFGWIDHDTPNPRPVITCTWPGCGAPHMARGLCEKSYARVHLLGWIDHDTPPARRSPSSTVYLIHHEEMNAVKIGVGHPQRQQQHLARGWTVLQTWIFGTPHEAYAAERRVLDLWDGWTGYLTAEQMPQAGHTETIDAAVYDTTAVQFAVAG